MWSSPESQASEGAASLCPGTINAAKKSQRSYVKNEDHLAEGKVFPAYLKRNQFLFFSSFKRERMEQINQRDNNRENSEGVTKDR